MRFDIMTLFPDLVNTVLGERSRYTRITYAIIPRISITRWTIRLTAAAAGC